ncbi:MAG: hypothetical protein HDR38_08630 [Treponema sp.]|nr:hypothetical protein [Treponema sp.]
MSSKSTPCFKNFTPYFFIRADIFIPRHTFLQKTRRNKQNAARFHGNRAGSNKMRRVFIEIASARTKRRAFSRKSRRDKQIAARFQRNCVGTKKTPYVFAETTPGQAKRRNKRRSGFLGQRPKPCWGKGGVWGGETPASEVEGVPPSKKVPPASKRENTP